MKDNFNSLNMDIDTEQWFTTLAQSSNPYQKAEDNREIEIKNRFKITKSSRLKYRSYFLRN